MNIRFQADADLDQTIVAAVLRREPGIDFQTASVAGLAGRSDIEVLSIAAREGRLLVSHDGRTMPRHFAMVYYGANQYGTADYSAASVSCSGRGGVVTDLGRFRL